MDLRGQYHKIRRGLVNKNKNGFVKKNIDKEK